MATPRSIPNRVVPHTSAGEYCAGNRVGGEAAARTPDEMVCDDPSARPPRGGAAAARWAHNPEVVGSNPTPATRTMSPRQHCRGLVTFRRTTCRAISRFQAAGPGFAHLPPERGFFIFVLLVTLFLLRHRTELAELRHFPVVRPQCLLLTSAAQGLVLLSIIWQLRLLLAASGFSVPLSRLFRADLHRVAVSTVTPAGSAAGALVFAADLQAAGVPTTAAAAATVTYGVVGLFSFLLLLPLTVLLLGTRQLISLPLSLLLFLGALVPIVLLLLLPWALRHGMPRLSRMSLVRRFMETGRS